MSGLSASERRLGAWSAIGIVALSVIYVATGALGMAFADADRRRALALVDPHLAICEALIILSAPLMVTLMAVVARDAPPERKAYGLSAFGFMLLLAGTTMGIHFVQLTVARRLPSAAVAPLSDVFFTHWPSVLFSLDLLAWDVFFGLSMLCASAVSRGRIRAAMLLSATLCLVGTAGPLFDMRWQRLAIAGYAFVFPVICVMLAILFRSTNASAEP